MNPNNNSTAGGGGFLGSQNIGGFGYGIGISFGILLLITTITLASYFCARNNNNNSHHSSSAAGHVAIEIGLDEATLKSCPKLLYAEAKRRKKDTTASCCSICLADYRNSDVLRLLPDCGHLFHLKCVDPWLLKHPTCPVCRTSPFPSPLSTPLAEVVPLASRPRG
ncbi:unnamed protein product [Linum tenue]|uniref:RING-type E3 ubiquitin transferase n=1 Tax=Linum tenue TaxID=586396 RepID=A0AAV0J921_9ROSI|nr:unnamed protein product [Linum tenue]